MCRNNAWNCHGILRAVMPVECLPLYGIFALFSVFGSCLLIHFSRILTFVIIFVLISWTSGLFAFWVVTLKFGGFYFVQSIKTIKSWKKFNWTKRDILYIQKFAKSCRPLKIGDQSRFTFNNLSVFCFIRVVTRGIIRALLTLSN